MKNGIRLFIFFLSTLLLSCSSTPGKKTESTANVQAPTHLTDSAIQAAAFFLAKLVRPNGQFLYRMDVKTGKVVPAYNIVRHAGAIYALCQYEKRFHEPQIQDAIIRASRFLISSSTFALPVFNSLGESMSAVFSIPSLTHEENVIHAPLGATGLGLVALLHAEEVLPGLTSPENLRRLGSFLIFMQENDGSFYDVYFPQGGRKKTIGSLYYPGEAIYALTLLYKWDHDPKWLNAAIKGMVYLAQSRAKLAESPPDNWALVSTEALFSLRKELPTEAVPLFISHSIQICLSDIRNQVLDAAQVGLYGSYTSTGRTTPTSARLEGLLAALYFLPPEETEFKRKLLKSIDLGIQFVLRAQIQTGPLKGAISDSQPGVAPVQELQIDYVQHALSAFLRYRDLGISK